MTYLKKTPRWVSKSGPGESLESVISSKYFAIVLNKVKPSYHHGMPECGKIAARTTFYLSVSAEWPEESRGASQHFIFV